MDLPLSPNHSQRRTGRAENQLVGDKLSDRSHRSIRACPRIILVIKAASMSPLEHSLGGMQVDPSCTAQDMGIRVLRGNLHHSLSSAEGLAEDRLTRSAPI